jgi:hypothetical protein
VTQQPENYLLLTAAAVLVIGGAGFLCGFIGPIVLNPEANQGPLLGIFVTGPLGALLGAAFGIVATIRRMSRHAFNSTLVVLAIVTAVSTLYFCLPRSH